MRYQLERCVLNLERNCLLLYSVSFRLIRPGLIRPTSTLRFENLKYCVALSKKGSWCAQGAPNRYQVGSLTACQRDTIARRHIIQISSQWERTVIEGLIVYKEDLSSKVSARIFCSDILFSGKHQLNAAITKYYFFLSYVYGGPTTLCLLLGQRSCFELQENIVVLLVMVVALRTWNITKNKSFGNYVNFNLDNHEPRRLKKFYRQPMFLMELRTLLLLIWTMFTLFLIII
jgi:hypothetical protein